MSESCGTCRFWTGALAETCGNPDAWQKGQRRLSAETACPSWQSAIEALENKLLAARERHINAARSLECAAMAYAKANGDVEQAVAAIAKAREGA